jgi:hypothetical protein
MKQATEALEPTGGKSSKPEPIATASGEQSRRVRLNRRADPWPSMDFGLPLRSSLMSCGITAPFIRQSSITFLPFSPLTSNPIV